jgi:hypothetical protein
VTGDHQVRVVSHHRAREDRVVGLPRLLPERERDLARLMPVKSIAGNMSESRASRRLALSYGRCATDRCVSTFVAFPKL